MQGRTERPAWRRYGFAVLVSALASAIAIASQSWLSPPTLAPFFGADALATWYGGLGPAVLAIVLSFQVIWVEGFPPYGTFILDQQDIIRLISFVFVSALIAALGERRDRAEAALRAGERRFRTMLETANEGVWLLDRGGQTRYANDRMATLLGASPAGLASASMHDFVFPEDAATLRERLAAAQSGRSGAFDFRFHRSDGREVLVLARTSPVRDATGHIVGMLGLFTDITERIEAERALRLLDDAGKTLASSLDYDETLQRVAWFAVPEIADWCVIDLVDESGAARRVAVAHADPELADLAARLMRVPPSATVDGPEGRVIQRGEPLFLEETTDEAVRAATSDADHRSLLRAVGAISAMVLPLQAAGAVCGAMTLFTTHTSNRRFDEGDFALAEQLARRSAVAIENARLFHEANLAEARYRGLFEGTKDGIMVFDQAGVCVDANPALSELLGYSRQELVGKQAPLTGADGPWSGEELARLRQEGQWRGEFELRGKNGATLPVETRITTAQLPRGPVFVAVLRDVSERKRFEHVQEEFLSALAHDLKNPLTTIRGQMQLLQRRIERGEAPDLSRLETALGSIDNATTRMMNLLEELADVMRLRVGQEIELHREPTDLVAATTRVVDEHARMSERHQIRLLTTVPALVGFWDGPRLERVLGNLLGNAIKYSPRGGEITVRLAREEGAAPPQALLSVEDRGVGIPAGDLDLVFERFRRAGNVGNVAGSGIGLAGAKRIVELHGGTIGVTSAEGEGSTFTVRLPILSADSLAPAARASAGARHD